MAVLRGELLSINAAALGSENPLPPVANRTDLHAGISPGEDLPADVFPYVRSAVHHMLAAPP